MKRIFGFCLFLLLALAGRAQRSITYTDEELIKKLQHVGSTHNQGLEYILSKLRAAYPEGPGKRPDMAAITAVIDRADKEFTQQTIQPQGVDMNAILDRQNSTGVSNYLTFELADQVRYIDSDNKLSGPFYEGMEALNALMNDSRSATNFDAYMRLAREKIGSFTEYSEKVAWVSCVSTAYNSQSYWKEQSPKWASFIGSGTPSPTGKEHPGKKIAKADVTGAVYGGISGCVYGAVGGTATFPGVGTIVGCAGGGAAGAVVGGVGGSAKAAIGAFVDWIFGD